MHVSKAWIVRSLAAAAITATCLTASVPSAFAWGDGFRGGAGFGGGFRGPFGGFRGPFGCFNCGAFAFRGGFFGFGPSWGWGWGAPFAFPFPYAYPYPFPFAYPSAGGYAAPPPVTYAPPVPQAPSPSGQSCFAGAYVCPMEHPVASGSPCYCLSNNRAHVPGQAG